MSKLITPNDDQAGYSAPKIIASELPVIKIERVLPGIVKISANLEKFIEKETKKPYLKLFESKATDDTGSIRVIWFNKPSLIYKNFKTQYILLGKVQMKQNVKTLINPIFTPLNDYNRWLNKLSKR